AILIMRINSDEIIKPLLYTGAGLGRSGEVLLVDQDLKTLMSLKYPLPDGTLAKPLEYKFNARQAVLAARGEEGITIGQDYREILVLAAYRHIRVTSEVRWGMVVKVDRKEVFYPLRQNLIYSALIGLINIMVILILTFVIARTISHPIRLLSQAARQVQAGNLNVQVPISTLDEVGVLSSTFNSMIQKIGNWHKELEDEVQTRTAQLSLKNEELAREISERKRVEEALKKERDKVQKYLDIAGVMLIVIGADQKVQLINKRGCEILGYSEEEIIGKNWFDLFVPERKINKLREGFQNVMEGKIDLAIYFESPIVIRSGREKLIAWHNVLLRDEENNILATLSSGEDIDLRRRAESELRDAEIRYRTLFEESPEGVMIIDPETALPIEFNNAACQQLGYSREEFAQLRVMDYEAMETTQETRTHIRRVLLEGSDTFETKHRTKHGEIRDVLVAVKTIRISGRDLFLVILRDITARKRAEEELKRMAEELVRSNVELQQFAYVVSHDLQEPLLTVSGYCQLIQRRYKGRIDEDADKFLSFAVEGAAKMQMLIQDLLTYAKVGSGEKDSVQVDCSEVLSQAVANLKGIIEKSGAVITCDPLPTTLANASQLVQLFQNLIANAIKFHGKEAPRIHISSECKGSEWVFSVRDNGIGIDPKYADRIFVIFHRLHSNSEFPGTGIGLATCKKIVEHHGGRIWVESQPKQGSSFYFTLPK
ncbi:MAG: PAS domain S-box protein, partial [Candidatus Tectomicrobia bacterium]|nr:PAS domain S-box protein [Candidatus Tectomicrobia bacterium]